MSGEVNNAWIRAGWQGAVIVPMYIHLNMVLCLYLKYNCGKDIHSKATHILLHIWIKKIFANIKLISDYNSWTMAKELFIILTSWGRLWSLLFSSSFRVHTEPTFVCGNISFLVFTITNWSTDLEPESLTHI